jgi:hypothetical protein
VGAVFTQWPQSYPAYHVVHDSLASLADDFVVTRTASVHTIRWWGGDLPEDRVLVRIFAMAQNGAPGEQPLYEGSLPVTSVAPWSQIYLIPIKSYRVTLPEGWVVEGGSRYHLTMTGGGWVGAEVPGTHWFASGSGGWSERPGNLAFQILGTPGGTSNAGSVP